MYEMLMVFGTYHSGCASLVDKLVSQ